MKYSILVSKYKLSLKENFHEEAKNTVPNIN
jgi:hypothetical protein